MLEVCQMKNQAKQTLSNSDLDCLSFKSTFIAARVWQALKYAIFNPWFWSVRQKWRSCWPTNAGNALPGRSPHQQASHPVLRSGEGVSVSVCEGGWAWGCVVAGGRDCERLNCLAFKRNRQVYLPTFSSLTWRWWWRMIFVKSAFPLPAPSALLSITEICTQQCCLSSITKKHAPMIL